MGRTAPATAANTTYGAQSNQAFNAEQADIGQYNTNEATLVLQSVRSPYNFFPGSGNPQLWS
ncbi:MAG: hypothetical protein WA824_03260 [Candidatus Sulfotelmatobacter sp.]